MTEEVSLRTWPVVIRQSRAKLLGWLIPVLIPVAIAVWMQTRPFPASAETFAMVVGFGICGPTALLFGWVVINPGRLVLDAASFTWRTGWKTVTHRWDEIEFFQLYRIGAPGRRGRPYAAYRLKQRTSQPTGAGATVSLGGSWSLPPQRLVDLLNEVHARQTQRR